MEPSMEPSAQLPPHLFDPSPFPVNISSYFRRPTKIVKLNTRSDSPRNLSRRRTTAAHSLNRRRTPGVGSIPKQGGPLLDHEYVAAARPISWHPNSMRPDLQTAWSIPQQFPDSAYFMHRQSNPFNTIQVNGLITPLSQPSSGGSCYNESFTQVDDGLSHNAVNPYPYPAPASYDSLWSMPKDDTLQFSTQPQSCAINTFQASHLSFSGVYENTAPPTPELIAGSHPSLCTAGQLRDTAQPEGEVLVGMGLYDRPLSPPGTQFSGDIFTLPHRSSLGKGLILEETFEPSTEQDGEGDEDDEDDGTPDEQKDQDTDAGSTDVPTILPSNPPTITEDRVFESQTFVFNDSQQNLPSHGYNNYFTNPIWNDCNAMQTWI